MDGHEYRTTVSKRFDLHDLSDPPPPKPPGDEWTLTHANVVTRSGEPRFQLIWTWMRSKKRPFKECPTMGCNAVARTDDGVCIGCGEPVDRGGN